MKIKQITLKEANKFVAELHRHHSPVIGHKFSIGCFVENKLVGIAIVGRPVSRRQDTGNILEVTRLCTDGTKNVCSKLYSSCARICKELGYSKIITYILEDETGTSLIASGWQMEAEKCGGKNWNVPSRERINTNLFGDKKYPEKLKKRYSRVLLKDKEV